MLTEPRTSRMPLNASANARLTVELYRMGRPRILPNGKRKGLCESVDRGIPRSGGNQYPLLSFYNSTWARKASISVSTPFAVDLKQSQTAQCFFLISRQGPHHWVE